MWIIIRSFSQENIDEKTVFTLIPLYWAGIQFKLWNSNNWEKWMRSTHLTCCMHAGPYSEASIGISHGSGSSGSKNRFALIGALAYGIPLYSKTFTPRYWETIPWTGPKEVSICGASCLLMTFPAIDRIRKCIRLIGGSIQLFKYLAAHLEKRWEPHQLLTFHEMINPVKT